MTINNQEELRTLYGEPSSRSVKKELRHLDIHCRNFIALSPILVISSQSADGRADVSPKGDAPGFVAVLDDRTLLVPDRLGNNRVDTMNNILENPAVGLLFMVPGMNETLRINGKAELTTDPALLTPLSVKGKMPQAGFIIHVEEAFLHCAKALIRSRLWDVETQIDRKSFPSFGRILADQIEGLDVEETEKAIEHNNTHRLY